MATMHSGKAAQSRGFGIRSLAQSSLGANVLLAGAACATGFVPLLLAYKLTQFGAQRSDSQTLRGIGEGMNRLSAGAAGAAGSAIDWTGRTVIHSGAAAARSLGQAGGRRLALG